MDESSLLDLLECSVCLERLDTTAKVLPCQHTFCRRCLENIVSSRNELRCPECRILVDCGVDDLPANILLVRLLDGIKQRPRNGGRPSLTGISLGCAAGISASPPGTAIRDLPIATRSSPVKNVPQLPCGKALYSYEGKEPGDLKFNKGDIIILRRKVDENWYHGELNGSHGFLPASYIQCIKPLSQTPPQGKALYDFEVKDKDQDKDCLTFTKDEILTVIRRVDDNWAEGMLGDKIGIFPILYVELNETAKQLMEMDKPTPVPGPSSDPGPPAGPCLSPSSSTATSANGSISSASANGSSSSATSAIHRRAEGKKNAKKRHSFTALSMTQRTAQALNNRHSMEISAPVLISSSDPRAAARIGDCPHLSSSAPPQDTFVGSSNSGMVLSPRVASVTGELLAAAKVQLPLNIYLAMYAYKPQKADELELRKGEMYRVMEKCQDGWFKGTSLRSGASGVFPGNYVTPVSRAPFAVGQARACLPTQAQAAKVVASTSGSAGPSSPVLLGSSSRSTPPLVNPSSSSSSSSPQLQSASVHLKNCLRMSGPQTVGQARTAMQLVHSPPAGSPERPTAAVSPLRPQGSPSRSPGPSGRTLSMVSPQHSHQGSPLSPAAPHRSLIPLTSAAAAITPPNVSAAHLNGSEAAAGPLQPPSPAHAHAHAQGAGAKLEEKKAEKKEKKGGGLLKLLSGAAAKKKSRSPPSVSPTHEPHSPAAAASEALMAGAMGCAPDLHPVGSHGRAGSCPIESEMQGAMGMEPLHRKSGSLDLNFSVSPPARQACSSLLAIRPEPKPLSRERYRVVVPYPPQSEAEIELKEGDIVFVHKKREDGWYKGTLQRTGRTGLFPGSFVEIF
ncbi:LOW QUALITY PROTEIN: E3 ubiquitin-protein ligase SH3RF3-like [Alosa alosa]|uniref:LOW QUALITY PROTEIN: E3 ubiquitin-protein ligase SH3RF3-like n=1 Tax=Alosa alosa TaxID=278164 RepID=UPI0020153396|nr:LOW QUALITY PROTEIN: E3 ubiquitin-protein ligase SH3RF3-like [Alosa alosa]